MNIQSINHMNQSINHISFLFSARHGFLDCMCPQLYNCILVQFQAISNKCHDSKLICLSHECMSRHLEKQVNKWPYCSRTRWHCNTESSEQVPVPFMHQIAIKLILLKLAGDVNHAWTPEAAKRLRRGGPMQHQTHSTLCTAGILKTPSCTKSIIDYYKRLSITMKAWTACH